MKVNNNSNNLVPLPRDIVFEITYRCNLKCQMCYLHDNFLNKEFPELSVSQIEDFLDSLLPHRPTIVLTGGEPFARSDILLIVEAVKKRGMRCCIFSNGTMLTRQKIKDLIELKLDSISFSLDGPKDVFEGVTRIPGSFDKLMQNLDTLFSLKKDETPNITLSGVLSKRNIKHLDFLIKFSDNSKISLISLLHLHFMSHEDSNANAKVLEKYNIFKSKAAVNRDTWGTDKDLAYKIIKIRQQLQGNKKIEFVPDLEESEIIDWYGDHKNFPVKEYCFHPWVASRIAPDGSVYVCQNQVINMGNIAKEKLSDIWNNEHFQYFRSVLKANKMFPGCNRCCKVKTYTRKEFPELQLPVVFF